ncbi:MAG: dTMP kinase [Proteobacteria bacterium]|nr:dTMP kinase [Pseudomonadota bacterium]
MFITFEGIDASGKTTQMRLLEETLKKGDYDIASTRQPGGTEIGQLIRNIVLNPSHKQLVPEVEVLLYMADRIQHLQEVVLPALKQGKIVLCDRYHDATLAYQGGGRQLNLGWLEALEKQSVITPDLTLWFDISVEESQKRLNQRNVTQDIENCRLESENAAFFTRVREGYHDLCRKESGRFVRIQAEDEIQIIQQKVLKIVLERLS